MTVSGSETVRDLLADLSIHAQELVVIETDGEGRIRELNPAALQALGRGPRTAAGAPVDGLLARADARTMDALRMGPPGRTGPRLVNVLDGAGSPFTVRAMVEVGPDGLVLAGVRSVVDETRLGDELVRLNNELAAATRESVRKGRELEKALAELRRTQALLVHQEKMASLGQTTAGVAHEINNPLAFVISNNEMLGRDFEQLFAFVNTVGDVLDALRTAAPGVADEIDEAAGRADLGVLAESVPRKLASNRDGLERIREIVADLRVFARLDEAEWKEVDLGESLEATLRFLGPLERDKDVHVVTDFPEGTRLSCSPGALNQAVSNVVANAVQASRPGQTVRVSLRSSRDAVRIRVEDEGCGIQKENLGKIFDPFFTTKAVGEGTGLGLSVTHQVVSAHGGTLEVESEPGRGTSMTLVLPVPGGGAR